MLVSYVYQDYMLVMLCLIASCNSPKEMTKNLSKTFMCLFIPQVPGRAIWPTPGFQDYHKQKINFLFYFLQLQYKQLFGAREYFFLRFFLYSGIKGLIDDLAQKMARHKVKTFIYCVNQFLTKKRLKNGTKNINKNSLVCSIFIAFLIF